MSKFVTVRTNENTNVHFPHYNGTYATLCSLDGDDNHHSSTQEVIPTARGVKVNCSQCIAIWYECHEHSRKSIDWSNWKYKN